VIKQNLMKILREKADWLEVSRDEKGEIEYDRELLSKFTQEKIHQYKGVSIRDGVRTVVGPAA
jgi:hypothetical protein